MNGRQSVFIGCYIVYFTVLKTPRALMKVQIHSQAKLWSATVQHLNTQAIYHKSMPKIVLL